MQCILGKQTGAFELRLQKKLQKHLDHKEYNDLNIIEHLHKLPIAVIIFNNSLLPL